MRVKIIGAGSIGNHMAQASRKMGWDVCVIDNDPQALERMKKDIYPKRYGAWDPHIQIFHSTQAPQGGFDIIVIGTPPDSHMRLSRAALTERPRLLHIEKPLATPDLSGMAEFEKEMREHPETIVTVGYDHAVSESIESVLDMAKQGIFGEILTLDVEFREHWRGIFGAHPWLAGPWESYLGYWRRGGGAGGEHSHALHLWLFFSHVLGWGGFGEGKVMFDIKTENGAEYDRMAAFLIRSEKGRAGRVVQDVIAYPVRKWLRLQGDRGFIEWHCNGVPEGDLIRYQIDGQDQQIMERVFPKKRPDDFYREVLHYEKLLNGKIRPEDSPLSYARGAEVMKILNKAHYG